MPSCSALLARIVFGTLCPLLVTLHWAGVSAAAGLNIREIAPGLYVHRGHQAVSNTENGGDIANIGFVVGERCVAVIDSGGSHQVGEALRQAVRAVTTLPICYVINTHIHPDHIFGNAAFLPESPVFVGHARLPAAMAGRGTGYRNALRRDLGPAAAESTIIPPTLTVADRLELNLGGRSLELQAWPTAHTDNDLSVFDHATQTLWLADLLFVGHTPVVDGNLSGWLGVIDTLAATTPRHVISGHGDSTDWRQALANQRRYLLTLRDEVRAAIRERRSLAQAMASVGRGEQQRWLLFDDFHRRNVAAAYAELEWED